MNVQIKAPVIKTKDLNVSNVIALFHYLPLTRRTFYGSETCAM